MKVPAEWKLLADSVPGLLVYVDAEGRLLLANSHSRDWLGCDSDAARGRSIGDVMGRDGWSLLAPHLERAASGVRSVFEASLATPAGPKRARISLSPHFEAGKPKGYTALMLEIFDKRKAEERDEDPASDLDEVFAAIGGHVDTCLGLLDSRHPLAANLREIRRAAEHGASLARRLPSQRPASQAMAQGAPREESPLESWNPPRDGSQTPSAMAPSEDSSPPLLLVVDDEASVRHLVARILEGAGFEVLEAGSGEEALEMAGAQVRPVDLLLTDVVMPGMGGRELARRCAERLPRLHVVYMSGFTDDVMLRHGLKDDAVAFLPKPFTPTALIRKVRETLAPAPGVR